MRICPKCAFANGDEFATCVWCNRTLADVEWTAPDDPTHPEHEKWEQQKKRGQMLQRQLIEAVALYSLVITFCTLAGLGYVWDLPMLLCTLAGGMVVGMATVRGWVGQLTAPLLQAALTTGLGIYFGLMTPIMFFAMGGHVFAAVFLSIWIDLIYGAHR